MGLLKEGAIWIGDHITQPIRLKKFIQRAGAKDAWIDKVVTHGLLEDLLGIDDKRVDWYIRTNKKPGSKA